MGKKTLWGITAIVIVIIVVAGIMIGNQHKQIKPIHNIVDNKPDTVVKTESSIQPVTSPKGQYSRAVIQPVDEGKNNPDFQAFREQMLKALERKDVDFLLSHLDDQIEYSFGADELGPKGFVKEWNLEQEPEKSEVWSKLREVLLLGGKFNKEGCFTAPYTFIDFPNSDDFDPMCDQVVTVEEAKVYDQPSKNAHVVDKLSYEVVKWGEFHKGDLDDAWIPVTTSSGINGYLEENQVRSVIDFRACFEKKNGEWKMVFFIEGD